MAPMVLSASCRLLPRFLARNVFVKQLHTDTISPDTISPLSNPRGGRSMTTAQLCEQSDEWSTGKIYLNMNPTEPPLT